VTEATHASVSTLTMSAAASSQDSAVFLWAVFTLALPPEATQCLWRSALSEYASSSSAAISVDPILVTARMALPPVVHLSLWSACVTPQPSTTAPTEKEQPLSLARNARVDTASSSIQAMISACL
jgi:hypothetical protein